MPPCWNWIVGLLEGSLHSQIPTGLMNWRRIYDVDIQSLIYDGVFTGLLGVELTVRHPLRFIEERPALQIVGPKLCGAARWAIYTYRLLASPKRTTWKVWCFSPKYPKIQRTLQTILIEDGSSSCLWQRPHNCVGRPSWWGPTHPETRHLNADSQLSEGTSLEYGSQVKTPRKKDLCGFKLHPHQFTVSLLLYFEDIHRTKCQHQHQSLWKCLPTFNSQHFSRHPTRTDHVYQPV